MSALIVAALASCGEGAITDQPGADTLVTVTSAGRAPRELTYFGYYASGWVAGKPQGAALEMDLSAYGDHVNVVDIRVDLAAAFKKVREFNQAHGRAIRTIVTVDPIFFGYDPQTICSWDTALAAWRAAVPMLHENEDLILAFSPIDEPYLDVNRRDFSEQQMTARLNDVSASIKSEFPDVPVYVNYGQGAPQRQIARGIDWISFTPAYGAGETGIDGETGEVYKVLKKRIQKINERLGRPQVKMLRIGHGFAEDGGWQRKQNGYTEEQKQVYFAQTMYADIQRENSDGDLVDVIGWIVFLWHDFGDGVRFGVQSAPKLAQAFRGIGGEIIARSPASTLTTAAGGTAAGAPAAQETDSTASVPAVAATSGQGIAGSAAGETDATWDEQAAPAVADTAWEETSAPAAASGTAAAATSETNSSTAWVETAPQAPATPSTVAAYYDDGGYKPPSGWTADLKKSFIDDGGWQWAAGGLAVGIAAVLAWNVFMGDSSSR